MVIVDVTIEGKPDKLYVDGKLNQQIDNKVIPNVQRKDSDGVYIVDGTEGSGKSVFGMQLGKKFDPNLSLDRICFTPEEFTKAIIKAKKHQCIIFDEAFTGLSSRGSLTEVNRLLVALMMEMRQKNLYVIIIMPTFFLLDKYVALWRARGLFHIYTRRNRRGFWMFFNRQSKKLLYLTGKKLYDYSYPRSNFKGRFYDKYVINEAEYRLKKKESMQRKSRVTRAETYLHQRNTLFWLFYDRFKVNHLKMSKLCAEYDFKIDRSSISKILLEKKKEILTEEAMREEEEKERLENSVNSTQKSPNTSDGSVKGVNVNV